MGFIWKLGRRRTSSDAGGCAEELCIPGEKVLRRCRWQVAGLHGGKAGFRRGAVVSYTMKTLRIFLVAAVTIGGVSASSFAVVRDEMQSSRSSEKSEMPRRQGPEFNIPFLKPHSQKTIDENRAEDANRDDELQGRMRSHGRSADSMKEGTRGDASSGR